MDPSEQVVEHLRVIRKYLAWIAFIMVFTFVLAIAGVVLSIANTSSSSDPGTDICARFPDLC
jgi:hypothetical protein